MGVPLGGLAKRALTPPSCRCHDQLSEMLATVPFPTSLCHRCRHVRLVEAARSTFLMCTHPDLPKYGPQPVVSCRGFSADERK
jgi:hypothetical protein